MTPIRYTPEEQDLIKQALWARKERELPKLTMRFARATEHLHQIARSRAKGLEWINRHVVSKIYVDRLRQLTGDLPKQLE